MDLSPDPVGHFGLSRWWSVAGSAALHVVSECLHCTLGEHAGVRVKRVKSIKSAGVGFKMPGKHIEDDYYKTKAK